MGQIGNTVLLKILFPSTLKSGFRLLGRLEGLKFLSNSSFRTIYPYGCGYVPPFHMNAPFFFMISSDGSHSDISISYHGDCRVVLIADPGLALYHQC